jgi:hypothetical protein
MAGRTYKIRKFENGSSQSGKTFVNYSLTVPSEVAELVPDDMRFECEMTQEGILFRPAKQEPAEVELPSWAKANGSAGGGQKRARPGQKVES